jgi:hypothetical protein
MPEIKPQKKPIIEPINRRIYGEGEESDVSTPKDPRDYAPHYQKPVSSKV